MRLIDEWRIVVRKALGIRVMLLAALLSGLEVVLPLLDGVLPIPPGIFAALSFVNVAAAFVVRVVAQKDLDNG
ncbi:hypothetical protein N8E89_24075 (plasmid) [Phyllobacterium sp. A18/5-2]|uniref:DUF7940 domain-containing protein n=1 Tax=Phyllobacterium sp. A18/5-2 TaxID=2978392 RepID=UPI0021CA06BE|nr:hypothetical protein [Phyllobacterium sp. A18/5-2]UXN66258.1 hypothetical protein N8E89_24075 [Phyllobacterium sp. A18/5-2]